MKAEQILKSIHDGNLLKGYQQEIRAYLNKNPRSIVILDDDPTGTQTVQNIPVVTNWSEQTLENELLISPVFFVLTNSRALQKQEAEDLAMTIGGRLKSLAAKHNKKLLVVSRGDSTLRGHYPYEPEILARALGHQKAMHAFIPAFFEGGRYTYEDVHYVRDVDTFIPAAQTPFAKDNTFGYIHSNLREYVLEKYDGDMEPSDITSVALTTLRSGEIAQLSGQIVAGHRCLIVNATSYTDLEAFALAALKSDKNVMYRTAASFVNAITGSRTAPLLEKKDFENNNKMGGLIIIGSYVPKTTAQLNVLKARFDAAYLEIDVSSIFKASELQNSITNMANTIDKFLQIGENVVLYTSRKLKRGKTTEESLAIVNRVSIAVTSIIKSIFTQPRFILTKGGITSCDIAVKSLQIQRAMVLGQLIKGVPVWQADENSKFPSIPFVIFPGNVGSDEDLNNALKKLE
ncbi:MAG: four-carbon acid sugar kinase family protein [Bacteroidota bacterium]